MQNAPRKGKGQCVYCGMVRKLTSDHVFPQSLFIVLDERMFTVPSCYECQRKKDLGDRDLEIYVALDIYGSHHPDAEAHLLKVMRRNEATQRFLYHLLNDAEEIPLVTDNGIQLSIGLAAPYNDERIVTAMQMVARGLFYERNARILAPLVPSHAERIPWNIAGEVLRSIGAHRMDDLIVKGDMVVWWGEMPIEKYSDDDGLFVVCLNDAVVFLLSTGTWATYMREAEIKRLGTAEEHVSVSAGTSREITLPRNLDGSYMIPAPLEMP